MAQLNTQGQDISQFGGTVVPQAPVYSPPGTIANTPAPTKTQIPTGGGTANPENAGKPGFDVFGNYVGIAAQTAHPQDNTAKPQTAFSSDQGAAQAASNADKLQTLKNTGLTLGPDGLARFSDSSFATAPSDAMQNEDGTWQSGGVRYAIGPSTTMDPELKAMNDQITQMKTQFDTTSRAVIDNIKEQFDNLIKQQGDINTRSQASLDQSLIMGGSQRYAQESSNGQATALMSYGLQQIGDLNTKEQTAVLQAQQAMDSGDMKLMDSSLSLAQKARDEKQAAAKELSTKLTAQSDALKVKKQQNAVDTAVGTQLSNGVTDPAAIVKALADSGITATAKDIADSIANLNPNAKEVAQVMADASKYGAPKDVLAAIGKAKNLTEAYQAANGYTNDPTSNAGMYATYTARTTAAGQTPVSPEKFLATQKFQEAYNTKAGANAADAAFAGSDKGQQKLEQDYRGVLLKELSNRSGGLGLQDAKVNQAIHLKALVDQFKDPNTGDYNVPTSQYYELAIGLASLVSGTNTTSDSDRKEIAAKTASGDLRGALQYITGSPQNGNTQEMIKNLIGSIDRQGQVAEDLRNTDVQFLRGLAPTDLKQDRKNALEKNLLPSYRNPPQDPLSKATQDESLAASAIKTFDAQSPENQKMVDELHAKFPNASAIEMKQALGLQ